MRRYNRYEKAHVLDTRVLRVSYGTPVLVDSKQTEPILIIAEEYDAGILPFAAKREGR